MPALRGVVPVLLRENLAFRRFFAGQSVSLVGDQISFIALPLVGVIVLHASATQMGYLTAAGLVPNLLFSLHAGAWIDQRGRRRQTMLAECRSETGPMCRLGKRPQESPGSTSGLRR